MTERNEGPDELAKTLRRNGFGWNTLNPYQADVWTSDRRGSVRRLPRPLWWLGAFLLVLLVGFPLAGAAYEYWVAS